MKGYNFDFIKKELKYLADTKGRIPTKKEINEYANLPSSTTLRKIFKNNGYLSYIEYLNGFGFLVTKSSVSPYEEFTINDLELLWKVFYKINNRYPTADDCNLNKSLPTWDRIRIICGNKFDEFYSKYGYGRIHDVKNYDKFIELYKNICFQLGRILKEEEFKNNDYGLPNVRWLIKNCPDKSVTTYNQFVEYLGYKPRFNISKELATKIILKKYKELGRNLKSSDFRYSNGDNEIGINVITRIWGSFNEMLNDLNLPINIINDNKDILQLQQDIKKLCEYIFKTENRNIISRNDIRYSEWCSNPSLYDYKFKKELNMNLCEFIESIGFKSNKAGMGMIYKFENGEITKSKYEFDVSNYLRHKIIKYRRNIFYKTFIKNYDGNKDCDYVIKFGNNTWYIEIAGMLDYSRLGKNKNDKIRIKYKKDLIQKEIMLKSNNLNYKIIYPSDFKENTLDEIFSFLY